MNCDEVVIPETGHVRTQRRSGQRGQGVLRTEGKLLHPTGAGACGRGGSGPERARGVVGAGPSDVPGPGAAGAGGREDRERA